MPVYANPKMLEGMSPELKKRMQGKACFNFTVVDKALFAELAQLTDAGFRCYQSGDILKRAATTRRPA